MIFVNRSSYPVPDSLKSPEAEKASKELWSVLSSHVSVAHLNQIRMPLVPAIWQATAPDLLKLFEGKCAYCETPLRRNGRLDVEHFRPTQVHADGNQPEFSFYYAWLAYDWENLLAACVECNRLKSTAGAVSDMTGKGGRFPVKGNRAPKLASVAECRAIEKTILIDPCYDNPAVELSFDRKGLCVGRTNRGKKTVDLLNLNRKSLVDRRASLCQQIKLLGAQLRAALERPESFRGPGLDVIAELKRRTDTSAPYTAAARTYLANELRVSAAFLRGVRDPDARAGLDELRKRAAPAPLVVTAPPAEARSVAVIASQFPGREILPARATRTLSRVDIENFNGIGQISIRLPPPDETRANPASALVLLGENSAGKSSVLQAIALALLGTDQLLQYGLDTAHFPRRRGEWNEATESARVRLYFGNGRPVEYSIDPVLRKTKGRKDPQAVILGYGPRRYFDKSAEKFETAPWRCITTLFDPMATIANPSLWLKSCAQSDFDAAVRALRFILMLPDEAFVRRGDDEPDGISIDLRGQRIPIHRLSDGYLSVFATAVDIMRHMLAFFPSLETAQGVVLIDELETHLHPRWKMRVLDRLRRALPRVQFIVTTHDPLCLRGALDGEVVVLERSPQGEVQVIDDLPNIQGLSVEQILASDCFGLLSTEDPKVEAEVSRYTTLATKHERNEAEEGELAELRAKVRNRIRIGDSPQAQLVLDSMAAYVSQEQPKSVTERRALQKETVERMAAIWAAEPMKFDE